MDADEIKRILGSVNIDQSSTIVQRDGGLLRVHITISRAANASTIMARMVELIERAGGRVTEFSYRAADSSLTLTIGTD
jgi:hypothetical protein